MTEQRKKLCRWFQRHGWHTMNEMNSFSIDSPILNDAGLMYQAKDTKTGENRFYCNEHYMNVELLGRFHKTVVLFNIYQRKHWWTRDTSVPKNEHRGYQAVPSDDFEPWSIQPTAFMAIPAEDILKLAEMIKTVQQEVCAEKGIEYKPSLFSNLKNLWDFYWIGRNSSYNKIKWNYSNERLRQEGKLPPTKE